MADELKNLCKGCGDNAKRGKATVYCMLARDEVPPKMSLDSSRDDVCGYRIAAKRRLQSKAKMQMMVGA